MFVHELAGRTRIKVPQLFPSFVDFVNGQAGGFLDLRDSIVSQVFQVVHDQRANIGQMRNVGRQLQQQALSQITGSNADRFERLLNMS